MKKSRLVVSSLAAISLVTVSACVTDPNTGEKKVSRTAAVGASYGGYTIYLVGLACLAAAARTRVARFQSLATVGVFLLGIWVSGTLQDPVSLVLRELFASDGLWAAHAEEVYIASAHRVLMGGIFAALGAWLFARYADA